MKSECILEVGNKYWYLNGKLHRKDGPAIERVDGDKYWYINGKLHRDDGPAIEYADGTKHWYIDGKMQRIDGPAMEHTCGTKYWYINDKLHRENGPAAEYADGTKTWWLNGERMTEAEHARVIKASSEVKTKSINLPRITESQLNSVAFVYRHKTEGIRVVDMTEAKEYDQNKKWKHLATLNTLMWIQGLLLSNAKEQRLKIKEILK